MREYKFRAWVTEYADETNPGYMIDLPMQKLSFDFEDGYILAFGNEGFWSCECYEKRKPKFVVMQFTGIKDSSGKDIYEGDILKRENGKLDIVKYEGSSFVVEHESGNSDFIAENNNFEIVGNIYENPDLINAR